jgi:hypothetical protein
VLNGTYPFVEIVSYPLMSRETKTAASCDQLRQMRIQAALIRTESPESDHLILADYVIVIKIARNDVARSNEYLLTNSAECKLARALAPRDVRNCRVFGSLGNHILKVDATQGGWVDSAAYLKCIAP